MKPTHCGMQDALQDNEVRPRPVCHTVFPASPGEADFDAVRLQAGRNTSYATAVRALPMLRAAR
jgi:hypothetical protein